MRILLLVFIFSSPLFAREVTTDPHRFRIFSEIFVDFEGEIEPFCLRQSLTGTAQVVSRDGIWINWKMQDPYHHVFCREGGEQHQHQEKCGEVRVAMGNLHGPSAKGGMEPVCDVCRELRVGVDSARSIVQWLAMHLATSPTTRIREGDEVTYENGWKVIRVGWESESAILTPFGLDCDVRQQVIEPLVGEGSVRFVGCKVVQQWHYGERLFDYIFRETHWLEFELKKGEEITPIRVVFNQLIQEG